jgi:hypothetical protein
MDEGLLDYWSASAWRPYPITVPYSLLDRLYYEALTIEAELGLSRSQRHLTAKLIKLDRPTGPC